MSKADNQREQERIRRHANIRRGMRIALYEVNQTLAKRGDKIIVPPDWIDYTVALAEGGRRKAPLADVVERIEWSIALRLRERAAAWQAARAHEFVKLMNRIFG